MAIVLAKPFIHNTGIIEVQPGDRTGYENPVLGKIYKFIITDRGSDVLSLETLGLHRCYSSDNGLQHVRIKVNAELGSNKYGCTILYGDAISSWPCTDTEPVGVDSYTEIKQSKSPEEHVIESSPAIPKGTILVELAHVVGTSVSTAANFTPTTSDYSGYTGNNIHSASYARACSDDLAFNYDSRAPRGPFTYCNYDNISKLSDREIQARTGQVDDTVTYISLEYALVPGTNDTYVFWVDMSPQVWVMYQAILWDMTYEQTGALGSNFNLELYSINGPTQTYGPGTHTICVQVNTGYAVFIDTVTITVDAQVDGCTDPEAANYNAAANNDDGSCTYKIIGCTDATATNYDSLATNACGSASDTNFSGEEENFCCLYSGCIDPIALNYNPQANVDDGSCQYETAVYGCTDASAWNYNPNATVNETSITDPRNPCIDKHFGCMDPVASNYEEEIADGVNMHKITDCDYEACTDASATNTSTGITVANYTNTQNTVSGVYGYWPQPAGSTSTVLISSSGNDPNGDSIPDLVNNSDLCTYSIPVTEPCPADNWDLATNVGTLDYNYIYDATPLNDGTFQLNTDAGKACISQLTQYTTETWAGISYKKYTEERVRVQRITCDTTELQLHTPNVYGEVVYKTTGLTDPSGAPTATAGGNALTNIYTKDSALAIADAAATAGWAGTITSTVYYYFVIISTVEDPISGMLINTDIPQPVANLFSGNNISKVTYHGGYYEPSTGNSSLFQTAAVNTTILSGYRAGTDPNGLIYNNASSSCGAAASDKMYNVYKVEVIDPCVSATVDFSSVFNCSVIGCTDQTTTNPQTGLTINEDNYNSNATASNVTSSITGLTADTIVGSSYELEGGCYHLACTDSNYVEYDSSATAVTDSTKCLNLKSFGCTDPNASNYDPNANINQTGLVSIIPGDFNNHTGLSEDTFAAWSSDTAQSFNGWLTTSGWTVNANGLELSLGQNNSALTYLAFTVNPSSTYKLEINLTHYSGPKNAFLKFSPYSGAADIIPAGTNSTAIGAIVSGTPTVFTQTNISFSENTFGISFKPSNNSNILVHWIKLTPENSLVDPCVYNLEIPPLHDHCSPGLFEDVYNSDTSAFSNAMTEYDNYERNVSHNNANYGATPGLFNSSNICLGDFYSLYTSESASIHSGAFTFTYNKEVSEVFDKTLVINSSNKVLYLNSKTSTNYYNLNNFKHNNSNVGGNVDKVDPVGLQQTLDNLTANGYTAEITLFESFHIRFDKSIRFKINPERCDTPNACTDNEEWTNEKAYTLEEIASLTALGEFVIENNEADTLWTRFGFNGLPDDTSNFLTGPHANSFIPAVGTPEAAQYPDGYVYSDSSVSPDCDASFKRPAYNVLKVVKDVYYGDCSFHSINLSPYIEDTPSSQILGCTDPAAANYNSNATANTPGFLGNTECVYFVTGPTGGDPTIDDTPVPTDGCSYDVLLQFIGAETGPNSNTVQAAVTIILYQIYIDGLGQTQYDEIGTIADWEACEDGFQAGENGIYFEQPVSYDPFDTTSQNVITELIPTGDNAIAGATWLNEQNQAEFVIEITQSYPELTYVDSNGETVTGLTQTVSHNFFIPLVVEGCTAALSFNYNPDATCNVEVGVEGQCIPVIEGCEAEGNFNSNNGILSSVGGTGNPLAVVGNPFTGNTLLDVNTDNGTCIPLISGCMDQTATNYNNALTDNGENIDYSAAGLTSSSYNLPFNVNVSDPSFCYYCPVSGITGIDTLTENFVVTADEEGTDNDISYSFETAGQFDVPGFLVDNTTEYEVTYNYINTTTLATASPAITQVFQSTTSSDHGSFYLNNQAVTAPYYRSNGTLVLYSISVTYEYNQGPAYDGTDTTINRCTGSNAHTLTFLINHSGAPSFELGCMDSTAFNFNVNATVDNGAQCIPYIYGCLNQNAANYNNYNIGNVTEISAGPGVDVNVQITADNDPSNFNDFQCQFLGCTDSAADNYNPQATAGGLNAGVSTESTAPNFCEFNGCTDSNASNYLSYANVDDGSCLFPGCTDAAADNYDSNANLNDGSCILTGCMDHGQWPEIATGTLTGISNDILATYNPQNVTSPIPGVAANNYNSNANAHNAATCIYEGCNDQNANNYDEVFTVNDGSCIYSGCIDTSTPTIVGSGLDIDILGGFTNYNSSANSDDCLGSSIALTGHLPVAGLPYGSQPITWLGASQPGGWIPSNGGAINVYPDTSSGYNSGVKFVRKPGSTIASDVSLVSLPLTEDTTITQGPQISAIGGRKLLPNSSYKITITATTDQASGVKFTVGQSLGLTAWTPTVDANANYEINYTSLNLSNPGDSDTTTVPLPGINLPLTFGGSSSGQFYTTVLSEVTTVAADQNTLSTFIIEFNTGVNHTNRNINLVIKNLNAGKNVIIHDINIQRDFCPDVTSTTADNSIVCYLHGCGIDGLYPDGHVNAGQPWATNYNNLVTYSIPSGSFGPNNEPGCTRGGCTNQYADNYDPFATFDNGTCTISICTDTAATIDGNNASNYYTADADNPNLVAGTIVDPTHSDYNGITFNDAGCVWLGCTNSASFNYDSQATTDTTLNPVHTSSCEAVVLGCTDTYAYNYNDTNGDGVANDPPVNTDNGSCCDNLYYPINGVGKLNVEGIGSQGPQLFDSAKLYQLVDPYEPNTVTSTSTSYTITCPASGTHQKGGRLYLGFIGNTNPNDIYGIGNVGLEPNNIYNLKATVVYTNETNASFRLNRTPVSGITYEVEQVAYSATQNINIDFEYESDNWNYFIEFYALSNNATVTVSNLEIKKHTAVFPLLSQYNCAGTATVDLAFDSLYDLDPLGDGGESTMTITSHPATSAGSGVPDYGTTIFTYSNVDWGHLDSYYRDELFHPTETYTASRWTAAANCTISNPTADSIKVTAGTSAGDTGMSTVLKASCIDGTGILTSYTPNEDPQCPTILVAGGGLNHMNTGYLDNDNGAISQQTTSYTLEFVLDTDDSNVEVDVTDGAGNILATSTAGPGVEVRRMIFSVPTGKENECTLQLDALSDNKYATISGLSLKRGFPIGIYDTLNSGKGVASHIRIIFNYPNASGALTGCTYDQTVVVAPPCLVQSGCTDNGLEVNGAGLVNDLTSDSMSAVNYNPLANTDDGSCVARVLGCTDSTAKNYSAAANTNWTTATNHTSPCYPKVHGCTDPTAWNYNNYWMNNVGGGTFNQAFHNTMATEDWVSGTDLGTEYTGSEKFLIQSELGPGSTMTTQLQNVDGFEYSELVPAPDSPYSQYPGAFGDYPQAVTGVLGIDVNESISSGPGSCIAKVFGCTDSTATNYSSAANTEYVPSNCCYDLAADDPYIGPLPFITEEVCDLRPYVAADGAYSANIQVNVRLANDNIVSELKLESTLYTLTSKNRAGVTIDTTTASFATLLDAGVNLKTYKYALDADATLEAAYLNSNVTNSAFVTAHIGNDDNRASKITVDVSYQSAYEQGQAGTTLCTGVTQDVSLLPAIGTETAGGLVYKTDAANDYSYIVKTQTLEDSVFGCRGTNISGAVGANIGDGIANTLAIEAACTTANTAADRAANLNDAGFTDWYLPSQGELVEIYNALVNTNLYSAFANGEYVSSTQANANEVKAVNFANGTVSNISKESTFKVLAVRRTNSSHIGQGDPSCKSLYGCTDPGFTEYYANPSVNTDSAGALIDNGTCLTPAVIGCTNVNYTESYTTVNENIVSAANSPFDYNITTYSVSGSSTINVNDPTTCQTVLIPGCTDPDYANFYGPVQSSIGPDGQDFYGGSNGLPNNITYTFTNAYGVSETITADHYNKDNGTCTVSAEAGCRDKFSDSVTYTDIQTGLPTTITPTFCLYTPTVNVALPGACEGVHGCTDTEYAESSYYTAECDAENGTEGVVCENLAISACTDPNYLEYDSNPFAISNQDLCVTFKVEGCTDSTYAEYYQVIAAGNSVPNFDPLPGTNTTSDSSLNNGSCINLIGCVDATNTAAYNPSDYTTITGDGVSIANGGNGYAAGELIYIGIQNATPIYTESMYSASNGLYGNPSTGCDGDTIVSGCALTNSTNYNYLANNPCNVQGADNDCCYESILGCTDATAVNFNPAATNDDGSCEDHINGCTNPESPSYNPQATEGNPDAATACIKVIYGCITPTVTTLDGGSAPSFPCTEDNTPGCYQQGYELGNGVAVTAPNTDFSDPSYQGDLHCYPVIEGCMDATAINYNNPDPTQSVVIPLDTSDNALFINVNTACNGCCIANVNGCTDSTASNYNPLATVDDGSCTYVDGCMDAAAWNYNAAATNNNGSCSYCQQFTVKATITKPTTDESLDGIIELTVTPATGFNISWTVGGVANSDYDGLTIITGLSVGDYAYTIYDTTDTSSGPSHENPATFCQLDDNITFDIIELSPDDFGCTDETAFNYDSSAIVDDGSCIIYGCTDPTSSTYNPLANTNDGTCIYIEGCTDATACNYNSDAILDNGTCTYPVGYYNCDGECNNPIDPLVYPHLAGYCEEQVAEDCLDVNAFNFIGRTRTSRININPESPSQIAALPIAVRDDGSCVYLNECVPHDIYDIQDALKRTISDHSKTVYTQMRTGMLEPTDMEILWKLQLVDYALNRTGNDTLFNCQDYDHLGQVTYSEGTVTSTNYLDRFLTFAFKHGDQHFVQVRNARTAQLNVDKFKSNRNKRQRS